MEPTNCIKVKRDGPRGWHWISRDTFDPEIHTALDAARIDPLDHDHDGKKGGSLPKAARAKKATD